MTKPHLLRVILIVTVTKITTSQNNRSSLRLAEFAVALSIATDMGLGHPLEMVLATCLLSLRLGELLGLGQDELRELYYLALFRHAGCTADSHRAAQYMGDELAFSPRFLASVDPTKPWTLVNFLWHNVYAERSALERLSALPFVLPGFMEAVVAHCEVAQLFAARLGLDEHLQAALLQCNEQWDGHGAPGKVKGEGIALNVRVFHVAETAIYLKHFVAPEAVVPAIRQRGGVTLDPAIAEQFCAHAADLMDPSGLESHSLREEVLAAEPKGQPGMTEIQLDAAAEALGDFADLKLPEFVGHSSAVAQLASGAGGVYGLPETDISLLRRAGHVHDLGRIGVSSSIWGKVGGLTEVEWERVRLHPYYTERILSRAPILREWGTLAAAHHERLDGSGYHRNLPAALLTPGMRILAAATAYRALLEDRPQRRAHSPQQAVQQLKQDVRNGWLDGEAVNAVFAAAGEHTSEVRREHLAGLTEREIEVLRFVARGLSNRQIAEQLVVSPKTVGNHLQNIYSKIQVSTRAAATFFAMQNHLV
jgi:HD-GYP domain-containing protein (c-di-GMP phosphodiesterase class II)